MVGEGRRRKDIAELLGVSLRTMDRWIARYSQTGLAGLEGDRPGEAREQMPVRVRAGYSADTDDPAVQYRSFAMGDT